MSVVVSLVHTTSNNSIVSAGSVLTRIALDLVVSKQKLSEVEGTCLVRMKREERNRPLAFSSRPFVLYGLPVHKPATGDLMVERRNGNFMLQIMGQPQFGLPFGKDRSVPIYLAMLLSQHPVPTFSFSTECRVASAISRLCAGSAEKRWCRRYAN